MPLDEKAFGDAPLCRAINQGLMVLTKERPRTAYEWLSIAQSELLRSSQNGNPSKKSRTRRRSKVVKPNNFREKPIKGTSSFTLPPIAPFLLVGAAASLILGGLAWSANQNGVFDKIFDGKMANERPASVSEPQDKGGENDAREEKKTPKERVFTTGQVFRDCSACPEMVVISAGSFLMGSNPSDFGYQKSEGPQRRVTISQNFAIGKYEVTVGDWKNCLAGGGCEGYDPAIAGTDMSRNDYPVSNIPYDAAKFYTSWLSQKTGQNYRLPSEGEWEYAARGGRASIYPWGNSGNTALASCRNCATKMATPAGSFPPNDFGLFDVVGSLWEWTEDCLNETYDSAPLTPVARTSGDCTSRVIRGGSYNDSLDILRVANRTSVGVSEPRASPHLGFRLYRDIKS